MAATRLRKTFQYPSESDDEDAVEQGMDEQDQDHLISTLSARDTSTTRIYTLLLSALPLAPALLHIPLLLSISTVMPSLAAIASFLASAYTLYFLPLAPQKISILNSADLKANKGKRGGYQAAQVERRAVPYVPDEVAEMLAKYMVPANAGLCVLMAVAEFFSGHEWSEGLAVGGGFLPGFVLSVVLWARRELRVVDMTELEKLKFASKTT
ncbi:hypothetical protein HBI04_106550 [Parastagonospora nodorum]|nr:hypothetical protein HBI03_142850 [Parastagonospora nodorum]KAH4276287.1 hypothetical protein HBI04_106550 [Parastagonospora nodorum]KAH5320007.1 hypothetical protein HBI50_109800 [Parastagonospora nodorum]KAH5420374.1 hypothetical protein HBI46_088880 [Parastagonospora nodorum]